MTALAPFSQNSAVWRCSGSGSGQAQPWQSKPSTWLSRSSVRAVRVGPICSTARFSATATAVGPGGGVGLAAHLEVGLVDVVARGAAQRADHGAHPVPRAGETPHPIGGSCRPAAQ